MIYKLTLIPQPAVRIGEIGYSIDPLPEVFNSAGLGGEIFRSHCNPHNDLVIAIPGTGGTATNNVYDLVTSPSSYALEERPDYMALGYRAKPLDAALESDYDHLSAAQKIIELIATRVENYPDSRIVLYSFSYGAKLTCDVIARLAENEGTRHLLGNISGLVFHSPNFDITTLNPHIARLVLNRHRWRFMASDLRFRKGFQKFLSFMGFDVDGPAFIQQLNTMDNQRFNPIFVPKIKYAILKYSNDNVVRGSRSALLLQEMFGESFARVPIIKARNGLGHSTTKKGRTDETAKIVDTIQMALGWGEG